VAGPSYPISSSVGLRLQPPGQSPGATNDSLVRLSIPGYGLDRGAIAAASYRLLRTESNALEMDVESKPSATTTATAITARTTPYSAIV
jgi:hypothetical protein